MTTMKSLIFLFTLFCTILHIIGDGEKFQAPIVILQRNVSTFESPVYAYWYHPKYKAGDGVSIVPSKDADSEYFRYIDSTYGVTKTVYTLGFDDDLNKYCVRIISENDSWNGTTCESKLNWMYDRKDLLGTFTIPALVIPGTHQSAAYEASSGFVEAVTERYAICQSRSIKKQLIDGIRYLDLRAAIDIVDNKTVYMLYHASIKLMAMDDAVQQINEFMDMSNDVVIVSFKMEPGSGFKTDDDHRDFQEYLERVFAKHAYPFAGWRTTLNSLWTLDKRLVLSCTYYMSDGSKLMWPRIEQVYANAQDVEKLEEHFDRVYAFSPTWLNTYRPPHAAMAELTHSAGTVAQDVAIGTAAFWNPILMTVTSWYNLRAFADDVAPHIFDWFTGKFSEVANIIAVDFYEGSGVVDLAIQLNVNRSNYFQTEEH